MSLLIITGLSMLTHSLVEIDSLGSVPFIIPHPALLAASFLTSLSTPIHQRFWDLCKLLKTLTGAGEMAQELKTFAAFAEDLGVGPSSHNTTQTACNAYSGGSGTPFWPLRAPEMVHGVQGTYTYMHTLTHTHKN